MKGSTRTRSTRKELKRFMETDENEETAIKNLWDRAKAVLRGKYITIPVFLKKLGKKLQIQKLSLDLI